MTQRVGLIGRPVEHSLSLVMHNAAFEALGLDWRYELLPVDVMCAAARTRPVQSQRTAGSRLDQPEEL